MKAARTLPPSAAPLSIRDVLSAALYAGRPQQSLEVAGGTLATSLGVTDLFWVSTGQAALATLLEALKSLHPGRAVAIPAYTCFSVPAAVVRAGLAPVLVDVNPQTFDFEAESLQRVMDSNDLLAVVPTHLFGIAADVDRVRGLLAGRQIFVIEDAAQALGCRAPDGRPLGSLGDAAILSFARGKPITCGQGGTIATRFPAIAAACERACAALPPAGWRRVAQTWIEMVAMIILIHPWLYWIPAGLPRLRLGETVYDTDFPITGLPASGAGALRRWRRRLDDAAVVRRRTGRAWAEALGVPLPGGPATPLLRFPALAASCSSRDYFLRGAKACGLGASRFYPSAVHQIPELRDRFPNQRFPGAEELAERLITLPTHRFVRDRDCMAARAIWVAAHGDGSLHPGQVVAQC